MLSQKFQSLLYIGWKDIKKEKKSMPQSVNQIPRNQTPRLSQLTSLFLGADQLTREEFRTRVDILASISRNNGNRGDTDVFELVRDHLPQIDCLDGNCYGFITPQNLRTLAERGNIQGSTPDIDLTDFLRLPPPPPRGPVFATAVTALSATTMRQSTIPPTVAQRASNLTVRGAMPWQEGYNFFNSSAGRIIERSPLGLIINSNMFRR